MVLAMLAQAGRQPAQRDVARQKAANQVTSMRLVSGPPPGTPMAACCAFCFV